MWGVLLRIGGAVLPYIASFLLKKFFPSLAAKPSPEVDAQAEKDRADILQSELDALKKADAARDAVRNDVAANPDRVREHDAFERTN